MTKEDILKKSTRLKDQIDYISYSLAELTNISNECIDTILREKKKSRDEEYKYFCKLTEDLSKAYTKLQTVEDELLDMEKHYEKIQG